MKSTTLVQKFWRFCDTLRDDGVGHGDYLEQLTFLLFLKLADEYANSPLNRRTIIPQGYDWQSLKSKSGADLKSQYVSTLQRLAKQPGMLGAIFYRAENKIQDPAKLSRLVDMIDAQEWISLDSDLKGDLYEGLLEKNSEDTKSGAGQYFTPRPLIQAIVACVQPRPMQTVADPACGTGGFFLGVHEWLTRPGQQLTKVQRKFLSYDTFFGNEIVPSTRRLCLMNLYLHDIGDIDGETSIANSDALILPSKVQYDYVLANPPFGKKSSMLSVKETSDNNRDTLSYKRSDFWASTSNKQLNFVQHIFSMLKPGGKAAVVIPDNVLYEGGAAEDIRRSLLKKAEVHTLLRLPTGIFYANGLKANVLFFDKRPRAGSDRTKGLWVYDLRSGKQFTLKNNPMKRIDLSDFVKCYSPEDRAKRKESDLFRFFSHESLIARESVSLDVSWARQSSEVTPLKTPDKLATEIIKHIETALSSFKKLSVDLKPTRRRSR
ncbi:class I SAM-dependent DNA methyltransferase [Bradyrhizobium sp. LjRoot220]|uniref:class I SAM-dependent DNA methyltransferase n=1 Tax=Bradyrhizobium sp. LjRoot220 TaxID=3342284 RepID=UPI003ECFA456